MCIRDRYSYISMSTDFSRPDDYLEELGIDLSNRQFKGKIIFDLLLCNGMRSNRFFSAHFDGEKFNGISSLKSNDITTEVQSTASEFYMQHFDLVERNQLLSKPQKFLIKKGRIPSTVLAL